MLEIVFWVGLSVITMSYMTVWYFMALYTRRYDVVDTAWGLGFILVAWVSLALRANFGAVQVVSALLVSLWGLRLSSHIANRNWHKAADDHRYRELRAKWGGAEKRKAYTNIFLLQGVLMLVVSLPMVAIALTSSPAPTWGVYIGWAVWLSGIIIESMADYQLAHFLRQRPPASHQIMERGLWRFSRHPNYFGEVLAWWGAALVALSLGHWWGVLGAATITVLITKISGIPPLEKHYRGNKAYAAYAARTSVFVPLHPKKLAATKQAIIYVPGLGDHRSHGQRKVVELWRFWPVDHTEVVLMQWNQDEAFELKLSRLIARIDALNTQGYRVSLVGVSAGASAAVHAYAARPDTVHRVVCICGKLQRPETISPHTYRANPAFRESMYLLPASLEQLDNQQRRQILSIRPLADESVPPADTVIPGARTKTIPAFSHVISIAVAITLYSGMVVRFTRKS